MNWCRHKRRPRESGQSMMEAALVMPLLMVFVLNGLNFGYFFLVAINLASSPRSGVEYSMEGFITGAAGLLPSPGPTSSSTSVSYLIYQDMSLPSASTAASVQVCSKILGLNGSSSTQTSKCSSFGSASFPAPDADPEAPWFVLNRVDVTYSFVPLIPGTPFNIVLLPVGYCTSPGLSMTCTLHTKMSMRAMD